MRFSTQQHRHYCGSDLHTKAMDVCILDQHGTKLVRKNRSTTPEAFLRSPRPRDTSVCPLDNGALIGR